MDLSNISNRELLSDVRILVGEERATTAKLVAYLGEVEERRLHLEAGFPSMFAFCTQELDMSENEAFRRLVAARLGRRFPVIHSLLASGAVHLSALELLREHLTDENHTELLEAVSGKSKTETAHQVFERDGLQCTYVSPDGRRCEGRAFLELDHVEPRALGGADSAENLRVRCRAHNQFSAEQAFGREQMARCRHFVRQKSLRRREPGEVVNADTTGPKNVGRPNTKPPSACDRLTSTLRAMGFRTAEAQRAIAHVASLHNDLEVLPIEQTLREALLAATPNFPRAEPSAP